MSKFNQKYAFGVMAFVSPNRDIHLTSNERDEDGKPFFHVTVSSNPRSVRYHRTLYRNLRRILKKQGLWPPKDES